jgi:hypothetical protein
VRHFTHDAVHEFLHLDGKIFQTLKLLISKPGELTLEYFRGRRARYISPVRLYLTCSLLYFAISAVAPAPNARWEVTADDAPTPEIQEALDRARERMDELRGEMSHQAPRAMFILMPVFAFTTWTLYRRSQPYYVPHLYYAIHFHAFVFLVFAAATALAFGGMAGNIAGSILTLVVFPYHYLGLRRTFGGTRNEVAWKGSAILVAYLLVFVVILAVMIFLIIHSAVGAGT